jgi:uncharacterized protein with HEPN domain
MDYEAFLLDMKTFRATTLCLIQIGEIVHKMHKSTMNANPKVDWNGIAGLRHRLVHDYEGINNILIWDIVSNEIPKLVDDFQKIISTRNFG